MAPGARAAGLIRPPARGAFVEPDGVRFRVYSGCAERVDLCLHAPDGPEQSRVRLEPLGDGDWEAFLPGIGPGQRYGFRVHGPWDPSKGLRCNPAKFLLDPYARRLAGGFHWSAAVFDYTLELAEQRWRQDERDSAPVVPHGVVTAPPTRAPHRSELRAWTECVVYETNVRGFTMRHPGLGEEDRGRLKGLSNGAILDYLKALGVNTVELMPAHAWIDERHLAERGLRNAWGYNTIGFFAVEPRLAGSAPENEFRAMVEALHEAGFEVLLDVVYNHTGEGDALGPTVHFRGLDNAAYYRLDPDEPGTYINASGTGNTLDADSPVVRDLVLDSLRYWRGVMGVDGFRFDIAPVLGLGAGGFETDHPLLEAIATDPDLGDARRVAEPWGPVNYDLGRFPPPWKEWNDRFRDTARRFWNGEPGRLAELARRIHGSADLFDANGRGPGASVHFVTAHDGFTLADLVSYAKRHNEANGEGNRDGHRHNHSVNHGVEGPTDRRSVLALRRRHRMNLLATVFFSQGVPMLLAGDEIGNSQGGNNNAYAQDNETGWVDWSGLEDDPAFLEEVRTLIRLRREHPLLRQPHYLHGHWAEGTDDRDIDWYHPEGRPMAGADWEQGMAVLKLLTGPAGAEDYGDSAHRLAVVINGHNGEVAFRLPEGRDWARRYGTDGAAPGAVESPFRASAWSVTLLAGA